MIDLETHIEEYQNEIIIIINKLPGGLDLKYCFININGAPHSNKNLNKLPLYKDLLECHDITTILETGSTEKDPDLPLTS